MKSTLTIAIFFLTVMLVADFGLSRRAHADATFEVNDNGDTTDMEPGNGVCADAAGKCTLRAAIEEANALDGPDTITFSPDVFAEPGPHVINLTMAMAESEEEETGLEIRSDLMINGPGANLLTVQRDGAVPNLRIFGITQDATVSISGLTISNGNTIGSGGGVFNAGTLTLTRVAIDGNQTEGSGGGFYTRSRVTIIESTISNNNASRTGGGITHDSGFGGRGVSRIINSTISGNSASDIGGIHVRDGRMEFIYCTITNNTSNSAGGISIPGRTMLTSTIVAGNIGEFDFENGGSIDESSSFNLIGTCEECSLMNGVNGNQIGVTNPGLAPLAFNGGPTMTHALMQGSPAIDKGRLFEDCNDLEPPECTAIDRDQRGLSRPFDLDDVANAAGGDGTDIGAYESRELGCLDLTLNPESLPDGMAGMAYSETLTATPEGSYYYSLLTGMLPPGFSLNPTTGLISGLTRIPGSYNFTIRALRQDRCSITKSYTLVIGCPEIMLNPESLPDGAVGKPYSATLSPTPATTGYTFSVTDVSLPPGLSLNSTTGKIAGTPTSHGEFNFMVTITGFGSCNKPFPYTIRIVSVDCPTVTLPDLPGGKVGKVYSHSVAATPAGAYTYSLTEGSLPPGLTFYSAIGLLYGYPTVPGPYSFKITATTSGGCMKSMPYLVTIDGR